MLELSLILFAGAILILPSDWRQGLFEWLRLRKLAAACVDAWWALLLAAQGPRYLSSSKWPKGGASSD